jgi:uncharacterized protein
MRVVVPGEGFAPEAYKVSDYDAYYRYVKRCLGETVARQTGEVTTYPDPAAHCEICKWWAECDSQRRKDDHLSFVAGLSRLHEKQLGVWDVKTLANLATFPLPLPNRPERGSPESYVRIREQARVQVAGRVSQTPTHELLPLNPEHGFCLIPEPSPGDVFFDLEADPFIDHGGREYLFGLWTNDGYECRWAMTAEEEKRAFEWFVDLVMARWSLHPGMHVYHFSGYEPGALKRLMGRHATRADEIDRLRRGRVLVDLHIVLKRAVRASVETYSLKALEAFHGFERKIPLEQASHAMRRLQHALELGKAGEIDHTVRDMVQDYNADDCLSTLALRDWLERERATAGCDLSRPVLPDAAASERVTERQRRAADLAVRLQRLEQPGCEILSHLLDWHRRESKADWWEFFRLGELSDEDLLHERSGLDGLQFLQWLGVERKIPADRYRFAKQDTDVRTGDKLCAKGEESGEVVAIDPIARTVDLKKTRKSAELHPSALYIRAIGPNADVLADSLYRVGRWVCANGVDASGPNRAARDLLLRKPSDSVIAIQGPSGTGKTFTGAHMIIGLVREGKKIGITATSHKVIRNLLDQILKTAPDIRCGQKAGEKSEDVPGIRMMTGNDEPLAALQSGIEVVGGTPWLWAREDYFEAVDVLFVD